MKRGTIAIVLLCCGWSFSGRADHASETADEASAPIAVTLKTSASGRPVLRYQPSWVTLDALPTDTKRHRPPTVEMIQAGQSEAISLSAPRVEGAADGGWAGFNSTDFVYRGRDGAKSSAGGETRGETGRAVHSTGALLASADSDTGAKSQDVGTGNPVHTDRSATPTPTPTPTPRAQTQRGAEVFRYNRTGEDGRMVSVPEAAGENGQWCGHGAPPSQARPYDIWSDNCHTAANAFLICDSSGRTSRGVLACGGDPTRDLGHHTANYEVAGERTCIYNWHERCCFPTTGGGTPDIVGDPTARSCARLACGDQYGAGTRVLPPGQMVEMPGPSACAREIVTGVRNQVGVPAGTTFDDPSFLPRCRSCCNERAAYWDRKEKGERQHDSFLDTCTQLCIGFFSQRND